MFSLSTCQTMTLFETSDGNCNLQSQDAWWIDPRSSFYGDQHLYVRSITVSGLTYRWLLGRLSRHHASLLGGKTVILAGISAIFYSPPPSNGVQNHMTSPSGAKGWLADVPRSGECSPTCVSNSFPPPLPLSDHAVAHTGVNVIHHRALSQR